MKCKSTNKLTSTHLLFAYFNQTHPTIIAVVALLLFLGCKDLSKEDSSKDEISETTTTSNQVHVAFAGGGWRAHTAHSSWTISLLNKGEMDLKTAFSNVGTISSNSGGSWFSTMLMYSKDFVSDIEASNANTTWQTSGWLGKQRKAFNLADRNCPTSSGYAYLECIFDTYTNTSLTGGTHWKLLIEDLIYKDYPLGSLTLNGARQPWATEKPLLLASTLLNNSVVLNKKNWSVDHRYYQACFSPSTPVMDKDHGSHCSKESSYDVTPATFSSIPSGLNLKPSPFLPELGTNLKSSQLNLGYTEDYEFGTPPKSTNSISLPLNNDNVPVMTAAAASSAAMGFGASERITNHFDASYFFEDDAISFSLAESKVQYADAKGKSLTDLANHKIVKLADGGPVDNSGVAQLVRFLQLNHPTEEFNIVAFDNVQSSFKPNENGANVGVDIASLFGHKEDFCFSRKIPIYGIVKYCIDTPDVQIFQGAALRIPATWSSPLKDGKQLIYTKYDVITQDNTALGIKGGKKGTLHSFTCVYPNAETEPLKGDEAFNTYDDMFTFINTELNTNGGLKHLKAAFGLK